MNDNVVLKHQSFRTKERLSLIRSLYGVQKQDKVSRGNSEINFLRELQRTNRLIIRNFTYRTLMTVWG